MPPKTECQLNAGVSLYLNSNGRDIIPGQTRCPPIRADADYQHEPTVVVVASFAVYALLAALPGVTVQVLRQLVHNPTRSSELKTRYSCSLGKC